MHDAARLASAEENEQRPAFGLDVRNRRENDGSGCVFAAVGAALMAGKRELIDTGTDKRYVRRDEGGRFK